MAIVKYNEWEFEVDVNKTKEYYNDLIVDTSSQVNRNFKKYCESLSKEEKEFFDKFGIKPEKVDCSYIDIDKKKITFSGYYYVYANVIKEPKNLFDDFDEIEEIDIDVEENNVNIGAFEFAFYYIKDEEDYVPEDMPEGCIRVDFFCDNMQWLLEEKCEYVSYYPPRFWEIRKRRKLLNIRKKETEEYIEKQEEKLSNKSIKYTRLSKREINKYKKKWIKTFTPQEFNLRDVKKLCYGLGTYLWHLFSYEFVGPFEGEEATVKFNKINKDVVLFFDNIEHIGYELKNLSNLTAEFLEEWEDVTIVDAAFTWTYSKTHEYEFGPFYYEKVEK